MEQKGPRRAPHPWSQRAGNFTWEPSRLPGLKWVRQMPSSPFLLLQSGGPLPPASPVLLLASLLCPQDQCGQGQWGVLEGKGLAWELSRLPGPAWVGETPSAPLLLLREGPSRLPLLISPVSLLCPKTHMACTGLWRGCTSLGIQQAPWAQVGGAIALHSSPSSPGWLRLPAYPDLPSLRDAEPVWPPLLLPPSVPPHPTDSLGGSSLLLGCQGTPPAASSYPRCGETLTLCLPTPPS